MKAPSIPKTTPRTWAKRQAKWRRFNRWEASQKTGQSLDDLIRWAGEAYHFYLRFNPRPSRKVLVSDYAGVKKLKEGLRKTFQRV